MVLQSSNEPVHESTIAASTPGNQLHPGSQRSPKEHKQTWCMWVLMSLCAELCRIAQIAGRGPPDQIELATKKAGFNGKTRTRRAD